MSETLTLNEVYAAGRPDRDEAIWDFVGGSEWDKPFPVRVVNPVEFVKLEALGLGKSYAEVFATDNTKASKRKFREMKRDAAEVAKLVIVVCDEQIVDGWHRMLALAAAGVTAVRVLDVADDE